MWISDELLYSKAQAYWVDELMAKKRWVDASKTCHLCHGTGICLKPIVEEPIVITHDTDGKLYRRGSIHVNGVIYRGYVEVDMLREPRSEEVLCVH